MKIEKYNNYLINMEQLNPNPREFETAIYHDMQTIKACLKYILQSYERAEGHPGASVVNSLLDKLEER